MSVAAPAPGGATSGARPTPDRSAATARWADARLAAALFAVDPHGLGGVALAAGHGPVREHWLSLLSAWLVGVTIPRRVPLHAGDDRLLGGLDLEATLRAGRPVGQTGLLAEADGGVLLLAMAERIEVSRAARICAAMDTGEVRAAREGLAQVRSARFGVVALDERCGDDPPPPGALLDRLAFPLNLRELTVADCGAAGGPEPEGPDPVRPDPIRLAGARRLLPAVRADDTIVEALCATAQALGVESTRAWLLAVRAARVAAALAGRTEADQDDAVTAARLVLAPRATRVPTPESDDPPPDDDAPDEPPPPEDAADPPADPAPPADHADPPAGTDPTDPAPPPTPAEPLEDRLLEAARAAMPEGLLARLALGDASGPRGGAGSRAGVMRSGGLRGRPAGVRPGSPGGGNRLALVDTLRAAAPWQPLRRREAGRETAGPPVLVRRSDLRIARLRERTETTTIFAVDASGSAALHRLAEAKGAVELLLADCYVRRDRVAVIAFRGRTAELLLPPTRSLVRAKRSLAGLPGGGGTPLAAGLDATASLAEAIRRRGGTPVVVLLTDGRANVARDGRGGRALAEEQAYQAARRLRAGGHAALLIDTSPQPRPSARDLARALGANYLPMPHADSAAMARSLRAATAPNAAADRGR